ncbi:hypothetical protein V501_05122 [Pseudogymnoascus sp. VKM F-4519 (FW-2642)]|nr:hypothetical protein V501_05122 [Pseudogymnoascus sp. VKM F-4519 (FW-2642)]
MSTSSAPMGVPPAIFGGIPSRQVDIPISAVIIACYLAIGATHMTIFQKNRRAGRKFTPSALCFGFSMSRVATFTMRIVWATRPTNPDVTIAANALVAAGVILLVILVAMVLQFKTTNPHIRVVTGILLKVVISFFVAFTFSPFLVLAITMLLPAEVEGTGKTSTKVAVIVAATTLLCWELGMRTATMLQHLPANAAPCKPAFYVFVPVFELAVSCMYAAVRVDRLFYVEGKVEGGVVGEEKGEKGEKV